VDLRSGDVKRCEMDDDRLMIGALAGLRPDVLVRLTA
jgi:hypothetical protein